MPNPVGGSDSRIAGKSPHCENTPISLKMELSDESMWGFIPIDWLRRTVGAEKCNLLDTA